METAAGQVVDTLVEPTKMAICTAIRYALSCKDNLHSLERQVNRLHSRGKDEKKKLEEAEREDQIATCEFENWEDDVKELQDVVKELKAEFMSMATCIGVCTPNIVSRARLSMKAERLTVSAKELYGDIPQISCNFDPYRFVERQTCVPLVGRDSVLEELQKFALDDTRSTIGIYGMAGVGKTELLNKFYNDFHHSNPNLRMVWVDMKDCHSVEDAQMAISQRLALRWNEIDKQETRATRISVNLNKKSFLLILDDVWLAVDFKGVGIPIGTHRTKSKVIVATRREDVCDAMEATKLQVKCLDLDEAWSLFIEKAGMDLIQSEPEIRHQAEILVKKCGGLPLALVAIGRAMATKKTPGLWKHAITTIENKPQQIQGMKDVLSCLKRSYDNLPDDKLRTCLLYCTLYPEDHDIYKNNIVAYCLGEGVLVDRFHDGDHIYNEGYSLLDVLKSASMLEPCSDPDNIKMHPMIRILALWIESGVGEAKCLIRAGKGLVEAPDVDDWSGVERISLMYNNIETLSEMPNSPGLLTLSLNRNPLLHEICNGFFQSMTNLKVLDISHTSIQAIPAEIGELVQLQYLDFCGTKITSLPKELGNLVNLRYFLLLYTPNLKSIPKGLIKKLSKLRVLYMYDSYENWKVDSVGEGVDFEELHFLKRLKTLDITVNSAAALRKLAGSYRLASCTRKLDIKLCPGLKSTLSTTAIGRCFQALKCLRISSCSDLEELSIDGRFEGLSTLPNLTNLVLIQLPRAKISWNDGHLQNLRFLTIAGCRKMRQLIHCDDETIEEEDESLREINVLPNLSDLGLSNMPELESLSCGSRPLAFPSLENLDVYGCPKLKKLPLHAEKLKSIIGQNSWWNELEWPEDRDHIKSKFQSIFNDTYDQDSLVERAAAGLVENDSVFEQLQKLAADDRVSIIGIYGMAGVGKTRLLEKIFHQIHLREVYAMIWIDMNGSHSMEEAQKAVAEELGIDGYQSKNKEELARLIGDLLNDKNFILILDNVWKVVDLNGVGIPTATCQAKHKIILATRIQDICDSMNATKLQVKCLEWDEAWSLFVEKAGQKLTESVPVTQQHATSLVKKCGGLPLALVTVGRAIAKKRTPEEWEQAVRDLENKPLEIRGMKDVLSCLKMSYDNLADDKLRKCLLYCSMFGEGRDISKMVLTNYYIGEGVLADHFADAKELYGEGCNLLDVLKGASLLEAGKVSDYVKMHPIIRVLALWIAGDKLLVRASIGLTEAPDAAEWRGLERISLMDNNIKILSGKPDCPSLLTISLRENPLVEICQGFFEYMKNLRVLDLSYTSIQEVPAEIVGLIELRYLNLCGTKISSLPRELANLIRLRFIGLHDTPSLVKIPQGLIASLTDLRALLMCKSYKDWKVDSIRDGIDFEELLCLKLLKVLDISVNTTDALQKLAGSSRLANSTRDLEISLSEGLTTLSTASLGSELKALKSLRLHQCGDLEELEIDVCDSLGSSTLPNLTELKLIELSKAKIIWKSGCLQNLRFLTIQGCEEMRQLIHCDDEHIEEEDKVKEINVLPNLYYLDLLRLPELESLSCGSRPLAFPSLEVFGVNGCPRLKKLPLNAEKLRSILGQLSWWNGLEWQEGNDNIKLRFKSIFVPAYH